MIHANRDKSRNRSIALISIFAIIILGLSSLSSWYGDDMRFKYFCQGGPYPIQELKSITDILPSQINHYVEANGRFIAHVLVQLFCAFLGPVAFGVFNAAMYIFLVLLMLSFIGAPIRNSKAVLSIIILIVLCFSTKMMPSCQIGYIWSFVVALVFVKIFLQASHISPWWALPLFLFAIIAGNFHEGVNFGIAGALFVWFIINLRRITALQWVMLIGFGIGALLIILSPASRNRVEATETPLTLSIANLLHYGLGLYVLMAALIAVGRNKKASFNRIIKENFFFLSAVIFSLALNIIISIGTSRQLYGMNLFCIIVALNILPRKAMSTFWLIFTGLLAALHLTIQVHNTWKMRLFTEDLSRQLATIDGLPGQAATLYIDSYPQRMCWYSPLDSYTENNSFTKDGNLIKLQYDLSQRYPNVAINILPKYLQCLDTVSDSAGVIPADTGIYVVYSRKNNHSENISVDASRQIRIPGTPIKKSHSTVRYALNDTTNTTYSYGNFIATIVSQWDYSPLIQISDIRVIDSL